jgi:hypothetical protein
MQIYQLLMEFYPLIMGVSPHPYGNVAETITRENQWIFQDAADLSYQ